MGTGKKPPVELDERGVQNALFAIGQPESWEELVKVGTAVKDALGENGRAMFVEWAENSHWGRSNPDRKERHNFSNNYTGYNTQYSKAGTLVWLANDRTGGEFSRQNAKSADFKPSPEYLAKQQERSRIAAERARIAEQQRIEKNAETVKNIQGWFNPKALPAKATHPYLKRKGVDDVPPQLTYYGGRVQIPLSDKDGNIIAAQVLRGNSEDGKPQKQVYGTFKGASFLIGDLEKADKGVIMAEGFATAYSLHKATGLPAIMAVSSSNFDDVAAVYREKLPENTPFIIAADDDSAKTSAGIKAAHKAAEIYGKDAIVQLVAFPDDVKAKFMKANNGEVPTDFNDLALYGSYKAVREQINQAIEEYKQRQQQQPETQQQEKNAMDNNALNPNNLNEVKEMRESDFRQLVANELQQGSLNDTLNELKNRLNDDVLNADYPRFTANHEMMTRIENALPDTEEAQKVRDVINEANATLSSSDDVAIQEIMARTERLANTWQPEPEQLQETPTEQPKHEQTFSPENPYAKWANDDAEVYKNATDWEMREPLTVERLAEFNREAQNQGFDIYIEDRHASLGVFQAEKQLNEDYRVEIIGEFINHSGASVKEAPRDFTVAFYEKNEIVNYLYTNDFKETLEKSNQWLSQQQTETIEQPAAVQTSTVQETASEKETHLHHFRENNENAREHDKQQAENNQEFLDDVQEFNRSFSSVVEPDELPQPEPVAPQQKAEEPPTVTKAAQPVQEQPEPVVEEPTVNEDGTNSVEKAEKAVQAEKPAPVKEEQPKPHELTEKEYQQQIYNAYEDGSLQKDFQKLVDKMEKAKTPETFREQYTEFNRMRNAIVELDANDNLKKEFGNKEEGSFKEQDGVKWAKLTSVMGAGAAVAATVADKDDIFKAAYEDSQKRAQRFKEDENAPKVQPENKQPEPEKPQPHIITAEEAQRNLNRSRQQQAQDIPEPEPVKETKEQPKQEQPEQEQPKEEQPEKTLQVEQPQIKLPQAVTEMYLVNRDKTELYNDRTGETQIYINSEKNQLKTKHNDFDTVSAMIQIAQNNNWDSITVKGTKEFRKLAWEMASIQGIEVKGYKPSKQEIAVMEARKAKLDALLATNQIEGHSAKQKEQDEPKPTQTAKPAEKATQTNHEDRTVRNNHDLPSAYYEPMNAGYGAGKVANFGSRIHPATEAEGRTENTPFIEFETASGGRHTVWGVSLKEVIDQNNIQVGDRLAIRVKGTLPKEWEEDGQKMSGKRKIWVVEDLVQGKRENKAQTEKNNEQKQTKRETLTAAALFAGMAAVAAQKGEKVTAYKPVEQAQIKPKQGGETQAETQTSKPKMVSR